MRGRGRVWRQLKLLHPRNLEEEVYIYGYHFSWKSHLVLIIGALAGISAIGILFRLKALYFAIIVGAVVLTLPVLVLNLYKRMYEQKRFADVADYMEQMLYAFQKSGKTVSAWRECREIFADGQMRRCLDEAIVHMELGKPQSERGILRESMERIESCYGCAKLSMVHELLASTEAHGGEIRESAEILLADVERWKKRGYRLQAEKKKYHADNMISITVATLLCAVSLYVIDQMGQLFGGSVQVELFSLPVIQISSTVFILCLLHIFVKSERNLTDGWLEEKVLHEPEYIQKSYELVTGKAPRVTGHGFPWAVFPAAAAGVCLLCGKRAGAMLCLGLMLLILVWRRAGYQLARRDVTEAMYLALPGWLMELTLLLQNNNVQVALAKSQENAPMVLNGELLKLRARLEESPEKLTSYTLFCKSFDLPEVTSCMKMLHAFSETGTGNLQTQMNHMTEQVGQMQDMADGIQNEKTAFRMKMIFSYPILAATVKLLIDLTVGMAVMLQVLGRMGGV